MVCDTGNQRIILSIEVWGGAAQMCVYAAKTALPLLVTITLRHLLVALLLTGGAL